MRRQPPQSSGDKEDPDQNDYKAQALDQPFKKIVSERNYFHDSDNLLL
jgi:hypothetical protein